MTTHLLAHLVGDLRSVVSEPFLNKYFVDSYAGQFFTGIVIPEVNLVFFACMGVVGGLLGSAFNLSYRTVSIWRKKYARSWKTKLVEVMVVTWLVHTVGFVAATLTRPWACKPMPSSIPSLYTDPDGIIPYLVNLERHSCPKGEYHQVATLYLNDASTSLRLLLHTPTKNPANGEHIFSQEALVAFVLPYMILVFLTTFLTIPSGFFVPHLLIGRSKKSIHVLLLPYPPLDGFCK